MAMASMPPGQDAQDLDLESQYGKLIGQHTFQREQALRTLGKCIGGAYVKLVYDSRPNTISKETRDEQWEILHDPYRYLHGLIVYLGPPSFFLYNLRIPLSLLGSIIILSAVYNSCHILYPKILPDISNDASWDIFKMGSFVLSLILSVKLGRVYSRFWEARTNFGKISGNLNMCMQLLVLYSTVDIPKTLSTSDVDDLVQEFTVWATVFPYTLVMQLLSLSKVPDQVRILLCNEEIQLLESTLKPRKYALMKLQHIVHQFALPTEKYLSMQSLLQSTETAAAACRRIKFSAMPYGLSQLYTGFIMIWLCIIPLGIGYSGPLEYGTVSDVLTVWLTSIILFFFALMMLSVDEVANQLEDPFHSMPLFDSLKTSLGHLAMVQKDFELLHAAGLSTRASRGNQP